MYLILRPYRREAEYPHACFPDITYSFQPLGSFKTRKRFLEVKASS